MTKPITKCRICDNENLEVILDLGEQTLSGIFPDKPELEHKCSLKLVKCSDTYHKGMRNACGHIQLEATFDPDVMYGKDYGYRSGLNKSMVAHLKSRVDEILQRFEDNEWTSLEPGDVVVDIAGNDGTTLGFYPDNLRRVNVDPTAEKFKEYQPEGVEIISDFFDGNTLMKHLSDDVNPITMPKVVTAFSVFYDLESPREFLMDIRSSITDDSLVVFEQSYMPAMFDAMSYDTICHEHISYFGLRQINHMFKELGWKFVDISFNECNGGSFVVTAAPQESTDWKENTELLNKLLEEEKARKFNEVSTWKQWEKDIKKTRTALKRKIKGKRVAALGASTKGNVLLQYCGLDSEDILVVGDVNPDKHGCFTPGTWIPITDEDTVLAGDYDYYLVLPWHFKNFFINSDKFKGKTLLFPLPKVHTVTVK